MFINLDFKDLKEKKTIQLSMIRQYMIKLLEYKEPSEFISRLANYKYSKQ